VQKAKVKGQPAQVGPENKEVTGFVFKIQANMDPKHRDRIAFFRMVSGKFQRGMRLKTVAGKQIGITSPVMFMAQDREIADEAFGGDVIGIPTHGALRVGDALSESGNVFRAFESP
jgi:peptide chain release factor 3